MTVCSNKFVSCRAAGGKVECLIHVQVKKSSLEDKACFFHCIMS